jgi:hypothetical protein
VSLRPWGNGQLKNKRYYPHSFQQKEGGLRPIALYRTAYRLYTKSTPRRVRKGASTHSEVQCNNAQGRWVGDSTWRNQVRSLIGETKSIIEVLLDIRKAFEHVNRHRLVDEAIDHDYTLCQLLASITSYRWIRHISYDGMLSTPIKPKRGIARLEMQSTANVVSLCNHLPACLFTRRDAAANC